jgi:hypothetical protein
MEDYSSLIANCLLEGGMGVAFIGVDGVAGKALPHHQSMSSPWITVGWTDLELTLIHSGDWSLKAVEDPRRSGGQHVGPIGQSTCLSDRWPPLCGGGSLTPYWVDFLRFHELNRSLMSVCLFGVYDSGPMSYFLDKSSYIYKSPKLIEIVSLNP